MQAFAEYLHERVRRQWGYRLKEHLTKEDLIQEKYLAAGYPAWPGQTENAILWELSHAKKASIQLTESFAMWPGASVNGLYFAHPEAKYFHVGKINRNQVLDYQVRKGMPLEELERCLRPNLNYLPEKLPVGG